MSTAPNLLNDDGTASMATAIMLSHHGFRRDLARFQKALARIAAGDTSRVEAVRDEWKSFHATLHGHHEAEDNGLFPSLAKDHEGVRTTIERLGADHRRIDPLLERSHGAFDELPRTSEALAIVRELSELLTPHLATEEAELIPFLRPAKTFPPPPNDEAANLYAQGFSWAMHGVAPEVLTALEPMLPEALKTRLAPARAAFAARCERVWGTSKAGAAWTSIPDDVA
jgi:iron-sulfur cluster repair protein YtfE (RIC family)